MEGIKEEEIMEGIKACFGIFGSSWILGGIRETGTLGQIGRKILNSKEFLSMEYQSLVCIEPSA